MKRNMMLVLGLLIYSVYCGIAMAFTREEPASLLSSLLVWLPLYTFCLIYIVNKRKIAITFGLIVRFIIAAAIALFLSLWAPSQAVAEWASYANGFLGVLIIFILAVVTNEILSSVYLFAVISASVKELPKLNRLWWLRFILLALVSSILVGIITVVMVLIAQLSNPTSYLFTFLDGLFSMVAFSCCYYYIVVTFLNNDRESEYLLAP